jgi:hypothetical protein
MILTGCKSIVLHPVDDQDIKIGDWCKPGWVCMSQEYVKQVMKVKLEAK